MARFLPKSRINLMAEHFIARCSAIEDPTIKKPLTAVGPIIEGRELTKDETFVLFQFSSAYNDSPQLRFGDTRNFINIEYQLYHKNIQTAWDLDEEIIKSMKKVYDDIDDNVGNPNQSRLFDEGSPDYIEFDEDLNLHRIERIITVTL